VFPQLQQGVPLNAIIGQISCCCAVRWHARHDLHTLLGGTSTLSSSPAWC